MGLVARRGHLMGGAHEEAWRQANIEKQRRRRKAGRLAEATASVANRGAPTQPECDFLKIIHLEHQAPTLMHVTHCAYTSGLDMQAVTRVTASQAYEIAVSWLNAESLHPLAPAPPPLPRLPSFPSCNTMQMSITLIPPALQVIPTHPPIASAATHCCCCSKRCAPPPPLTQSHMAGRFKGTHPPCPTHRWHAPPCAAAAPSPSCAASRAPASPGRAHAGS